MVSNRRLAADEALDWGLVSEVVPQTTSRRASSSSRAWYAALPTRAVAMTKQLFEHAHTASMEDQLALEARLQQAATQTEDFAEASLPSSRSVRRVQGRLTVAGGHVA
jgi:2-(1,2-epoxy-1,2-dihydrophenyl)acetyl-CoA isomerase